MKRSGRQGVAGVPRAAVDVGGVAVSLDDRVANALGVLRPFRSSEREGSFRP